MILAHGKILENKYQKEIINHLYEETNKTIAKNTLNRDLVIEACDKLARRAIAGEFNDIALPLLEFAHISIETYYSYARMFTAESLREKVNLELKGLPINKSKVGKNLYQVLSPKGILLHIAAGNVDALPAYSVIEGLLAGNINLLKLPTGDSGLSIKLLSELISMEPTLADYIYVFDVPSIEIETIKSLADIADVVICWGGDAAISACHQFIKPNTELITWGHKLSFSYCDMETDNDSLYELALDICRTNQMYCSSAQGIFVDTNSIEELEQFANRFFEVFKKANTDIGKAQIGARGKNSLLLYNDSLEDNNKILNADGVSVVIKNDSELELSYQFRNVWIKKLPHEKIISTLKKHKNHLQSCALLINDKQKRNKIIELLSASGVARIVNGNLSELLNGESHDGKFPLREYSKIIDIYED